MLQMLMPGHCHGDRQDRDSTSSLTPPESTAEFPLMDADLWHGQNQKRGSVWMLVRRVRIHSCSCYESNVSQDATVRRLSNRETRRPVSMETTHTERFLGRYTTGVISALVQQCYSISFLFCERQYFSETWICRVCIEITRSQSVAVYSVAWGVVLLPALFIAPRPETCDIANHDTNTVLQNTLAAR